MGCGASKGAVVNSVEGNIAASDRRQRPGDKGNTAKGGSNYHRKAQASPKYHQQTDKKGSKGHNAETNPDEQGIDTKVSDLTPVEFLDRLMQLTSVDGGSSVGCADESKILESKSKKSESKKRSSKLKPKESESKRSDLQNSEAYSDREVDVGTESDDEPRPSNNTVNDEDSSPSAAEHSKHEAFDGTREMSQNKVSEIETEGEHTQELIVNGSSQVSSSHGRFAAFDVPVSTDSKPLLHKFSDKGDKKDEGELMEKLQEKQRAAAARKEEELKKKARASGRVSMKDRLRREIMESRRQDEEAGLLNDADEAEEDETEIPDEIEKDTYFNEPTQVDDF